MAVGPCRRTAESVENSLPEELRGGPPPAPNGGAGGYFRLGDGDPLDNPFFLGDLNNADVVVFPRGLRAGGPITVRKTLIDGFEEAFNPLPRVLVFMFMVKKLWFSTEALEQVKNNIQTIKHRKNVCTPIAMMMLISHEFDVNRALECEHVPECHCNDDNDGNNDDANNPEMPPGCTTM